MKGYELSSITQQARHFKRNNEVDRAAEIKALYAQDISDVDLIDVAAVGSVVYCLERNKQTSRYSLRIALTRASSVDERRLLSVSFFSETDAVLVNHANTCPKRLLKYLGKPATGKARAWRDACENQAAYVARCKRIARRSQ